MPLQPGHERMPDPSKLVDQAFADVDERIGRSWQPLETQTGVDVVAEPPQDSAALRRGATVVGIVAALPAAKLGSWAGSNLMSEMVGEETIEEIREARESQNTELLKEHQGDMLTYILGTAVVTLLAASTIYGYTKNRALKKWRTLGSKKDGQEGVALANDQA